MPITQCQRSGKHGYKFGDSGYCYVGPAALPKAKKQGKAIEWSKHLNSSVNKKHGRS